MIKAVAIGLMCPEDLRDCRMDELRAIELDIVEFTMLALVSVHVWARLWQLHLLCSSYASARLGKMHSDVALRHQQSKI